MYSDTHCHLPLVAAVDASFNTQEFFSLMAQRKCLFLQDIGTQCDDLAGRIQFVSKAFDSLDEQAQNSLRRMIHFSAGIWPSPQAIRARMEQMKILQSQIEALSVKTNSLQTEFCIHSISAIGECGLDHHWNPNGADSRTAADFDKSLFEGERELFTMQLELAKKLKLPVIIHSRDAAEDTLSCITESGYDCGVIHCFSYGIEEAKKFLDRGWYISFSGSITYTKKSKLSQIDELLRFVPDDMLLLETDAPYLAPEPFRGKTNTPLLIENTYRFAAEHRGIGIDALCSLVDNNACRLFQ